MPATDPVAVAMFDTHAEADAAVRQLQKAGFDLKSLSVIGKDFHTEEHAVGFYNAGDQMKFWGKLGAFWGGLFGLLAAPAMFILPGVGHLIVLGPFAAALVSGLEGAALSGGVGVLAGALASVGVPKDSLVRYETEITAGKFLLVAHGTASEVAKAQAILGTPVQAGDTGTAAAPGAA